MMDFSSYIIHVALPLSLLSGGRGLLREVWPLTSWDLDYYLDQPLSLQNAPQEKAYRDFHDPRQFGERFNFAQRYSGFFVPPVTSLYTFAIVSDDLSRLYVSPTANADDMELIAYADQHTSSQWNRFESQTSEPMMLEQGKYYYMEAYSNQGPGVCCISCIIIPQKPTAYSGHHTPRRFISVLERMQCIFGEQTEQKRR